MTLLILAWLGGVLTVFSPCILPVLPFVFSRLNRPFVSSGLPLLVGMALAFTAVASLAAAGGGWAVHANDYGRVAAMSLLVLFALTLLSPRLATWLARPLVRLGNRITARADGETGSRPSVLMSLVLGAATGLLWAPCAGPILGLILTGAALNGPGPLTSALLLAYAGGAASSIAVALLAGRKLLARWQGSLAASEWARRLTGVAVLAGVAAIATGTDTGLLSSLSYSSTSRLEQHFVDAIMPSPEQRPGILTGSPSAPAPTLASLAATPAPVPANQPRVRSEGALPSIDGASAWINAAPLTSASLQGKVVLIDFWTYSCINCLRTLPYVRAWADKYKDEGLVVIGVHSPEFAFEKNESHVRRAVTDLGIRYPVAVDSSHTIWRAFSNRYWPALYFVDAQGRIRHHVFGEGAYEESERVIQGLLAERNGKPAAMTSLVSAVAQGVQAAPGTSVQSQEAYLGHERAAGFAAADRIQPDTSHAYQAAAQLRLNQWTLGGPWTVEAERAVADGAGAKIAHRFRARDLHLVIGRSDDGKPVRFKVLIDGKPPLDDHGSDIDSQGNGVVDAHRLYQLVRLRSAGEHTFEIEFLEGGAHVYAFTFG